MPGSRTAMSSNIFNVSSLLLLFLLEYGVLSFLFFHFFVTRFSFLKSVSSISVLIKCPLSPGILFSVFFFGETNMKFILSWSAVSKYPAVFSHSADILFTCFLCPTFFLKYLFLILFATRIFFS